MRKDECMEKENVHAVFSDKHKDFIYNLYLREHQIGNR